MSLIHPISAVENVLDEYQDHLRTEFRARDPRLQAALAAAMERPHFLAQEPFYQAHRPFRAGEPWSALGLDARLARAVEKTTGSKTAYFHQSEAISHLRGRPGGPLVVTTGTGSGKTESFLLPVLQNAIEDAVAFQGSGLTALLVYPMNALANDQERRIGEFLAASGYEGVVQVARYDRRTDEAERDKLRRAPPHLLLTNYMMLEYLLVRPADREALFANHRCRFLVLDEVHTYRGSLGTNIALLLRRLRAHLERARQDWALDKDPAQRRPPLTVVATSATIKSVTEDPALTPDELHRLRDRAVQDFVGQLTGTEPAAIRVIGEEFADQPAPREASWPAEPVAIDPPNPRNPAAVKKALAALAGQPEGAPLEQSARHAAILWTLGEMLRNKPRSLTGIARAVSESVPARKDANPQAVLREVRAALHVGATLGDTPGALRLRTHRFIRGGWKFHRCLDPECGHLFAKGEAECDACGCRTAPLLLCRACGADALHMCGPEDPEDGSLEPMGARRGEGEARQEWILYTTPDVSDDDDDDDAPTNLRAPSRATKQMKKRPVLHGSYDPAALHFAKDEGVYPLRVTLAPARSKCLVCGTNAAPGTVLTPVTLGTSAAVRVLTEGLVEDLADQHRGVAGHDGKERVLIFADSRQDAAHQARFVNYAGRFDRMRRRVVHLLSQEKRPVPLPEVLTRLLKWGFDHRDNPCFENVRHRTVDYVPEPLRLRALAWEEAPLLDDLAVSANFRATLVNLGLVGVRYNKLEQAATDAEGKKVAAHLGISTGQLVHLGRCLLDDMRAQAALSRSLLKVHPRNPHAGDEIRGAAWERRRVSPAGFPCNAKHFPLPALDRSEVAEGIEIRNTWRRAKTGKPPRLQAKFERLLARMGDPTRKWEWDDMRVTLEWLQGSGLLAAAELAGLSKHSTLLQVEADAVSLELVEAGQHRRCSICNVRLAWAERGAPCPACHGVLELWPVEEVEANRYVRRTRSGTLQPLIAEEHTAQITSERRSQIEDDFNAKYQESPLNVLSCSPTLEMGIDIAGLDSVILRNVPPRPDNYAQRGGRAGRHKRIGIVLGYARNTPHDQYFFDKPEEMIAGQVAAPPINLSNRDIVLRHLTAIAFGASDPGLAGRMEEYIDIHGALKTEPIAALKAGLSAQIGHAADLALAAWGPELLTGVGLADRDALVEALQRQIRKVDDLFERVAYQIIALQQGLTEWFQHDTGSDRASMQKRELVRRLLGIPPKKDDSRRRDADDRGSGHPMRRFAEFGLLPGYEFPSEPATVRLLGDQNEDEPISVVRRFGLVQYQPEAPVHARGHRWRVCGLDMSSPWNPRDAEPWWYRKCGACDLAFDARARPNCPRCGSSDVSGKELPGYEFGGFLAVRDDTPVLEEEDRFSLANRVRCLPQWDGREAHRAKLPTGWLLTLRREETVRWLNEGPPPKTNDHWKLHDGARGFDLCPSCGRLLQVPPPPVPEDSKQRGRSKPRKPPKDDGRNHQEACSRQNVTTNPIALTTSVPASTLRIHVELPLDFSQESYKRWGLSLGFALRTGMRHLYMLDGPEIEFELESMWEIDQGGRRWQRGALTFIDPAVGGSGFLDAAARDLQHIARRALEHLDHDGCDTACYRCLKSYQNQRFHEFLSWPHAVDHLEIIASAPPELLVPQTPFDPRPWLEAYDAGVGSPLELEFLRLFERHNFYPDKQVQIRLDPGSSVLTIADFALERDKLAIYIDGAAFHRGANLRRDQRIRKRLREAGWRVAELTARELGGGAEMVDRLRSNR